MIRPILNVIKSLQSNTSPGELAAGAVMALFFGLTPLNHTHTIFLVLCFFLFRINRAVTMILLPFLKLFYYLGLAHLADAIGTHLLIKVEALGPFWARITHMPVLAYLDLQYTLVLGGFVLAFALAVPVYILAYQAVLAYRARFRDKINNWRIVKWLSSLAIVQRISKWMPGADD